MELNCSSANKDQKSNKFKIEIRKLKELLIKQQNLLNKINDENLQLNQKLNYFENSTNRSQSNLNIRE